MLPEQVKELAAFDRLVYWVKERESIRRKREAGKPAPWTDDPILQKYRFCNVRRMDDKVSKWLLDNWYKPYYTHRNAIAACALARFVNLPSSLEKITKLVYRKGDPAWFDIKDRLRALRDGEFGDENNPVFNGAYMVRGNDGMDKIECVVDYYVRPMWERHREESLVLTSTMLGTHALLSQCYGFGSFMAGQVVADLRHCVSGDWSDRLIWAPVGPGSARGMNRLHGRDLDAPVPQDQFSDDLTDLIGRLKKSLSRPVTERLEAMDYQNCLCEFDKYERTLWEGRRPKAVFQHGTRKTIRKKGAPVRTERRKMLQWKKRFPWLVMAAEMFFHVRVEDDGRHVFDWAPTAEELRLFVEARFPGVGVYLDTELAAWTTPWPQLLRNRVYYMYKGMEPIETPNPLKKQKRLLMRATPSKEHWHNWKERELWESRVAPVVARKLKCKIWREWL